MTVQLWKTGGASLKAVGERLVLSSNAELGFSEGAVKMLMDKELKKKKKEVDEVEALWSKAQKDIVKSKVGLADDQADILAIQEQAPLPVCQKWTRLQVQCTIIFRG